MSSDYPSVRMSFGKQVGIELRRLVHPSYVQPLLVGRQVIEDRTPEAVWAFFGLYVGAFVLLMLALMTRGMDAITAFGSVATCMNNMGPGLGETAAKFAAVSDAEKMDLRPGHAARAVGDLYLAGVVYAGVLEGLTWAASRQGKNED